MKLTAHSQCWLAAAMLFGATTTAAWAQETTRPDAGWNARMKALQEEHDAQADVAISIVFDDSGSMNDNHKMSMAKQAFRSWIEHAPDSYRFGLVALNAGELVPLRPNDRAQILAAVGRLVASGGTPLADTIAQTAAEIRARRAAGAAYERQVVVILTDGEDTSSRGIKGVQDEIRALCVNRVEVIAFGYQGEGDYMRKSATHFYSPENGEDIGKGLNAIGSEIGDTSDVLVDDATRAAMQKVTENVPAQRAASPVPATSPPSLGGNEPFSPDAATPVPTVSASVPAVSAPAVVARKRSGRGHPGLWLVVLVVVLALWRNRRR